MSENQPKHNKPAEQSESKSTTMHDHLDQGHEPHTLAKTTKKGGVFAKYKFRWWYAVILVLLVAVVGVVVLRFSNASTGFEEDWYVYPETSKYLTPIGRIGVAEKTCQHYIGNPGFDEKNCLNDFNDWSHSTYLGTGNQRYFFVTKYGSYQVSELANRKLANGSSVCITGEYYYDKTDTINASIQWVSTYDCGKVYGAAIKSTGTPPKADLPAFDDIVKQRIQIALRSGVSVAFLKTSCESYSASEVCKDYVDKQYEAIYPPGNSAPPPPVVTPPPCLASTGCNNGANGWQILAENPAFYFNAGFEGGATCVAPLTSTQFDFNNKYSCESLKIQARCKPYYDAIARGDTSKVATTPDECGGAELRAALDAANLYQRNLTPPIGNVEGINGDCTVLYGWTASDAALDKPLGVDVYNGPGEQGQKIANNLKANIFRQDLYNAFNHKYGGSHGFQFAMPDSLKDNQDHTLYVYSLAQYINGFPNPNNNKLIGTKTINCDSPPRGNLEKIEAQMSKNVFTCTATGWTADDSSLNTSLNVDAYVDGKGVVHNAPADQFRGDLLNAKLGNGKHQYVFDLPPEYRDAKTHILDVYGIGVGKDGRPNGINKLVGRREFKCDQPPTGNVEEVIVNQGTTSPTCAIKGWSSDPSYFFGNSIVAYYDPSPDFKTYSYLDKPYRASLNRPDLVINKAPVAGNPNHGFVYPVPKRFFDGKNHNVYLYSLNVDRNGVYIAQNNTYIGRQTIKCPALLAETDQVNTKTTTSETSNQVVGSSVTKGVDTNTNQQITAVVTRTPLAYDQLAGASLVNKAATTSSFKNDKQVPATIPSTVQLAQTQADGDNGETLKGTVYIKPDLPIDIGIDKVVVYVDGKNPKVYNSIAEATRELDTKMLPDGIHNLQILAFSGTQNVRALNQRIQTNNGGLNALQRFFYSLTASNN